MGFFKDFVDLDAALAALAVFKDHVALLLVIIAIAAIGGSRLQRWVDDGEIRKLKAGWDAEIRELKAAKDGEINVLKERLNLAHDRQEGFTEEIEQQKANSAKLEREVAELKTELANVKVQVPAVVFRHLDKQLDKVAGTSAVMASSVDHLSAANLAVGQVLTLPSGKLNLITDAPKVEVTRKSE
jgi:hypothetical protein